MTTRSPDGPDDVTAAATGQTLAERARFLGEMIRSPRRVGSIVPTGIPASRLMASFVEPGSGLPVLELGPGTGPVTRQILACGIAPAKLHVVEFAPDLCKHLRDTYPGIDVINGDAFDLDTTLGSDAPALFDCVVSAVPLLNFGQARANALLEGALARVPPGRPMVQITYGRKPPVVPNDATISFTAAPWIMRNIPPARIWTYWRGAAQTATNAAAA